MYLNQTCLSQHYGRRAKTTSTFLKGSSCCPGKTSPSDTSLKRMWVVDMFYEHIQIMFLIFWTSSSMLSIKPTQSKAPKAVISMKDLNACFQPEKISHAHGLQISYLQDERIRNLFVYHDNGQVSSSAILFTFLTDKLESIKPVAQTPNQCGLSRLLTQVQQIGKLSLCIGFLSRVQWLT